MSHFCFFFVLFVVVVCYYVLFVMDAAQVLYSVWDPLHPPPSELRELNDAEEEFQKEYANRTGERRLHVFR